MSDPEPREVIFSPAWEIDHQRLFNTKAPDRLVKKVQMQHAELRKWIIYTVEADPENPGKDKRDSVLQAELQRPGGDGVLPTLTPNQVAKYIQLFIELHVIEHGTTSFDCVIYGKGNSRRRYEATVTLDDLSVPPDEADEEEHADEETEEEEEEEYEGPDDVNGMPGRYLEAVPPERRADPGMPGQRPDVHMYDHHGGGAPTQGYMVPPGADPATQSLIYHFAGLQAESRAQMAEMRADMVWSRMKLEEAWERERSTLGLINANYTKHAEGAAGMYDKAREQMNEGMQMQLQALTSYSAFERQINGLQTQLTQARSAPQPGIVQQLMENMPALIMLGQMLWAAKNGDPAAMPDVGAMMGGMMGGGPPPGGPPPGAPPGPPPGAPPPPGGSPPPGAPPPPGGSPPPGAPPPPGAAPPPPGPSSSATPDDEVAERANQWLGVIPGSAHTPPLMTPADPEARSQAVPLCFNIEVLVLDALRREWDGEAFKAEPTIWGTLCGIAGARSRSDEALRPMLHHLLAMLTPDRIEIFSKAIPDGSQIKGLFPRLPTMIIQRVGRPIDPES